MDNFTFDSFIKKIDIKTTPLLIAVDVVLIIAKFYYKKECLEIVLPLIGISIYLFVLFLMWAFHKYSKYSETKSVERERSNNTLKKIKEQEELIWNYFLGLPDNKLQNLVELVKLPEVSNERNKRVIDANSPLKFHFTNVDYCIPLNLYRAYYLIERPNSCEYITTHNDENLVVIINPYFLSLLETYTETGKKIRV